MKSGIYCILNTANGKRYVGQSKDMELRIQQHFAALRSGRHHNAHMQKAFKKDGEECFESSFIVYCDPMLGDTFERKWISHYKSNERSLGYNLDSGGNTRKVFSKESREKMSRTHTGMKRNFSPEGKASRKKSLEELWDRRKNDPEVSASYIKKVRDAHEKALKNPEYRKKLSETTSQNWASGKMKNVYSKETNAKRTMSLKKNYATNPERRKKMSETMKRKWADPEYSAKVKLGVNKAFANPETLRKRNEAIKKAQSTPEYREKISESQKKAWTNPAIAEKRLNGLKLALTARLKKQAEKIA